jgi:hypothetical protein
MFSSVPKLLVLSFVLASGALFANPISPLICSDPGSTDPSATATSVYANSCTDFSYTFPAQQPATGLGNWQYGFLTGSNANPVALDASTFAEMSATPAFDANGNPIPGQNAGWYSANFFQYWTALDAFGAHSNAVYTDYHTPPYCTPGISCNPTNPTLGGFDPRSPTGPDSQNYWADRRYLVPDYTGPITIDVSEQKDPRTAVAGAQGFMEYVLDDGIVVGSINVPVNLDPNAANLPSTVPGAIGQPIYSITLSENVKPGDVLDFVTVPDYDPALGGYADFSSGSFQLITIQGIPEPATLALIGGGLFLLGFARKRFRKS